MQTCDEGSGASLTVTDNLISKFEELKVRRKLRYLTVVIGETLIDVDKSGDKDATYSNLKNSLPFTDCRYVIYDQEYQSADRGTQNKLWLICWFPDNATTYNKMAYTSAKSQMQEKMTGVTECLVRSLEELDEALGVAEDDEDSDMDL